MLLLFAVGVERLHDQTGDVKFLVAKQSAQSIRVHGQLALFPSQVHFFHLANVDDVRENERLILTVSQRDTVYSLNLSIQAHCKSC